MSDRRRRRLETAKSAPAKAKETSSVVSFTDDEGANFVHICLSGKPKTGKTTFMGSAPNPFVINTDKGLTTLNDLHVPYITIERVTKEDNDATETAFLKVRSIIMQFKRGIGPVVDALNKAKYEPKTLCIDSGSALSDLFEVDVVLFPPDEKDREDTLQIQDYNTIQRRMFQILDLARELPMNLIVSFGLDVLQDDMNRIIENPSATGNKLGPKIPHFFDEVYVTSFDKEEEKFIISPSQTRRFTHAGSRFHVPFDDYPNATWKTFEKWYKRGKK